MRGNMDQFRQSVTSDGVFLADDADFVKKIIFRQPGN